jgi:DNA-binding XRE family transcriptional regulator
MKNKKFYTMEEIDKQINWTPEQMRRIMDDVKFKRVAYTIREIRLSKKLTQQMLAVKAGIPRSVVSRIESGKRNVTLKTLMNIADSMGEEVEIRFVKKQKTI